MSRAATAPARGRALPGGLVLLVLVLTVACGSDATPPAGGFEVFVEKNVPARMRDGVLLRADVYRPDTTGTFPALLQRTPYSKSSGRAPETFSELASLGYVVVVQDTRGRYTSEGVAVPHDEAEDGYDTVEWWRRSRT